MIFHSFELSADCSLLPLLMVQFTEQLECVLPVYCQYPIFFSPEPWIPLSFDR